MLLKADQVTIYVKSRSVRQVRLSNYIILNSQSWKTFNNNSAKDSRTYELFLGGLQPEIHR